MIKLIIQSVDWLGFLTNANSIDGKYKLLINVLDQRIDLLVPMRHSLTNSALPY